MANFIEWLKGLPTKDRRREAHTALRNMARISAHTGMGFSPGAIKPIKEIANG